MQIDIFILKAEPASSAVVLSDLTYRLTVQAWVWMTMLQHQQEAMSLLVSSKSRTHPPAASVAATFRPFTYSIKRAPGGVLLQLNAFGNRWDPKIASLSHLSGICMNGEWRQKIFFFFHFFPCSDVFTDSLGNRHTPLLFTLPPVHAGTCLTVLLRFLIGIWRCAAFKCSTYVCYLRLLKS